VEAAGGVLYGRLVELAVVDSDIRLTPSGFKVSREVVFRRLRVSVKVKVTVLLTASFELAWEVLKDGDNL
jgi:hypothetical protein